MLIPETTSAIPDQLSIYFNDYSFFKNWLFCHNLARLNPHKSLSTNEIFNWNPQNLKSSWKLLLYNYCESSIYQANFSSVHFSKFNYSFTTHHYYLQIYYLQNAKMVNFSNNSMFIHQNTSYNAFILCSLHTYFFNSSLS